MDPRSRRPTTTVSSPCASRCGARPGRRRSQSRGAERRRSSDVATRTSGTGGERWRKTHMRCSGWRVPPPRRRFALPFAGRSDETIPILRPQAVTMRPRFVTSSMPIARSSILVHQDRSIVSRPRRAVHLRMDREGASPNRWAATSRCGAWWTLRAAARLTRPRARDAPDEVRCRLPVCARSVGARVVSPSSRCPEPQSSLAGRVCLLEGFPSSQCAPCAAGRGAPTVCNR